MLTSTEARAEVSKVQTERKQKSIESLNDVLTDVGDIIVAQCHAGHTSATLYTRALSNDELVAFTAYMKELGYAITTVAQRRFSYHSDPDARFLTKAPLLVTLDWSDRAKRVENEPRKYDPNDYSRYHQ